MSRPKGADGLTPEIQNRLCAKLRAGNHRQQAAVLCGIARRTFYRWLELGEQESETGGKHYDFLCAVERAEAVAESRKLRVVSRAAYGDKKHGPDWKAALAFLERRFPDRWARTERHEVSGKDGGTIRFAMKWPDAPDSDSDGEG
jgi:hypothetical protein